MKFHPLGILDERMRNHRKPPNFIMRHQLLPWSWKQTHRGCFRSAVGGLRMYMRMVSPAISKEPGQARVYLNGAEHQPAANTGNRYDQ